MPEIFLGSDRFAHDRSFFLPVFRRGYSPHAADVAQSCTFSTLPRAALPAASSSIRNPDKNGRVLSDRSDQSDMSDRRRQRIRAYFGNWLLAFGEVPDILPSDECRHGMMAISRGCEMKSAKQHKKISVYISFGRLEISSGESK